MITRVGSRGGHILGPPRPQTSVANAWTAGGPREFKKAGAKYTPRTRMRLKVQAKRGHRNRKNFDLLQVKKIKRLFDDFDNTSSGTINAKQLIESMQRNRFFPASLFNTSCLDFNKDGTIGFPELLKAFYPSVEEEKIAKMVSSVQPPKVDEDVLHSLRNFYKEHDKRSVGMWILAALTRSSH